MARVSVDGVGDIASQVHPSESQQSCVGDGSSSAGVSQKGFSAGEVYRRLCLLKAPVFVMLRYY